MKAWKTALWTLTSMAVLGAVGCDVFVSGRSRQEPVYVGQPQYVQQQPAYVDQQPQYVIVQQAPPPVRIERRPAPPSGNVVWIDGYWNWNNQSYNWVGGRYEAPPQADVVWVAPRYDTDARGYRYSPGRWVKQNPGNDRGRGRGN